jgi:GNAT superfamily N-acetyltransferase
MRTVNNPAESEPTTGLPQEELPSEDQTDYVSRGGELSVSNASQLELLLAMKERGVSLKTRVRGFSMVPFVRDLDVLTIAPLSSGRPRLGEVVAFKQPGTGRLALHRIIKQTASGWLVKGDSSRKPDGEVSADLILGRVTSVERRGRRVHFGLGPERSVIALLSRGRGLSLCRQLWLLPRRVAAAILRRVQGLALYGRLGRKLVGPVEVSLASNSDLEQACRAFNFAPPHRSEAANPCVSNFVAKTGDKVIGFTQLVERASDQGPWAGWWIHSTQVRAIYRGLGVGEELSRQAIAAARAKGASELLLTVSRDNSRATKLNKKLGFAEVTLPDIEPLLAEEETRTGQRQIVMRKSLG